MNTGAPIQQAIFDMEHRFSAATFHNPISDMVFKEIANQLCKSEMGSLK